jgi:hypothetical protein
VLLRLALLPTAGERLLRPYGNRLAALRAWLVGSDAEFYGYGPGAIGADTLQGQGAGVSSAQMLLGAAASAIKGWLCGVRLRQRWRQPPGHSSAG